MTQPKKSTETALHPVYTVIGLMSGTSVDGIDAAVIRTDGRGYAERLGYIVAPYEAGLQEDIRACFGQSVRTDAIADVERRLTLAHAQAVRELLRRRPGIGPVDLIGFHGQTIFHAPDEGMTWQLGDGDLLAAETGIDVVHDFRSLDVAAGGQGAPLVPVYHQALARAADLPRPLALLNLGGIGNVTWIGPGEDDLVAFDTGPANGHIDDWMRRMADRDYDRDGAAALAGTPDRVLLDQLLASSYFDAPPPKSLDRLNWPWDLRPLWQSDLPIEDGAATLAAFTAESVARALPHLPQEPLAWYVGGGGRHNRALMKGLRDALGVPVHDVDTLGWEGDALEAEAFAYLAVRARDGLPCSFPGTTGCPAPLSGGVLAVAPASGSKGRA